MSKDTIYREDAIKEIEEYIVKENEAISEHPDDIFKYNSGLLTAIQAVHDLPSADRPQGEWVRDRYWSRGVGMGEDYGFFYKCSLCEYEVENGYTRCDFNFCPYCGADMRNSSEKLNNCETCKYGEDKHRYTHICNECGVGINNYEPKDESFDKDINVHSKNEP